MRYRFTEKEIREILGKIVVLVDTREKANDHITNWMIAHKIPYKIQKVDYGDYSCYLPEGSFKGQARDIYFTNDIAVERKFCIDELAMNLKSKKENLNEINKEIIDVLGKSYLEKVLRSDYLRIKQELCNMNKYNIQFFIYIEDNLFHKHIREGKYRSQYDPQALYARIKGLESEFNTKIVPIAKEYIASEIYATLKMGVRNVLIHKGLMEDLDLEENV